MTETPGILAGVQVLDLSTGGALLCGRLLADLGAEVVAIEPPEGNPARSQGPFWHDQHSAETSLYWLAYSHGKRSVTIDFHNDTGRTTLQRLLGTADVLIESFPPGHLENLGLGYTDVASATPDCHLDHALWPDWPTPTLPGHRSDSYGSGR
jgi:benzylsuccinate CoA-transferase BbsE subunit/naphthyl-2-methylsuccinate CoA transferase subunit